MRISNAFRIIGRSAVASGILCLALVVGCRAQQAGSGPQPASAVRFAEGMNVTEIPFKVIDDNMFLTICINDSVVITAAFDSGFPLNGVLIIDSAAGRRLGLTYVSAIPLRGAGDDPAIADLATGATVSLPGVSFPDQYVLVARDAGRYAKWLADGIIGGTLLNACIVEIDHEKSVLRVHEKDSFTADAQDKPLELTFVQGIPVVRATITDQGKSKEVLLLADTGGDVPFSIHSTEKLGFAPPRKAISCYIAEGINGDVQGQWARMDTIRLGPYTMKNCLVAYPTEGFDDVEASLGQNGFFGLAAQSRFTVTFDYPHSRMYLKPNTNFTAPFEFNMAGLVISTLPDGMWEVTDIVAGSPGETAGIKKGELIVALDGRETSSVSFAEMERIFTQEGRSVVVTLKRDGGEIDIPVPLKRLI